VVGGGVTRPCYATACVTTKRKGNTKGRIKCNVPCDSDEILFRLATKCSEIINGKFRNSQSEIHENNNNVRTK
jgi:hypothetical protein